MNFAINLLIRIRMFLISKIYMRRFLNAANHPKKTQTNILMQMLRQNRETEFGKKHNFSKIKTYNDFLDNVPVHTYEDLRPYIDKQRKTGSLALNIKPVKFYATTSSTTGEAKYIPITRQTIEEYKISQKILSSAVYIGNSRSYDGKILAIVSPAIEGYLSDGSPYGAMSGLVHQSMPSLTRKKYLVPYNVLEIKNSDLKYLIIATLSVAEENVTLFATANPSTIVRILSVINKNIELILNSIELGDLSSLPDISEEQIQALRTSFIESKVRAKTLRELYAKKGFIEYNDLWPNIHSVVCWTKGSCGVLVPKIKKYFSKSTKIIEMGYLASEFRGSVTINSEKNHCLANLTQVFFEFVERSNWDDGTSKFQTLDEVRLGVQYYIFATTSNGLYRYFINDIVEITGFFEKTPLIEFIQKGKGVTNLTGEKLYEGQLLQALTDSQQNLDYRLTAFMALADPESIGYILMIEGTDLPSNQVMQNSIDKLLCDLNVEYSAKRESQRLLPIKILKLKPGAFEEYQTYEVSNGQRDGQFKIQTLQYTQDCSFKFKEWTENED